MMEEDTELTLDGPLEAGSWPDTLQARVVTPGEAPRVHGYAIETDIACNYGYSEYLLLCLTGELPEPACVRAFDATSIFLGPVSVAHASTHAGVLSRLCGARNSGTIGVGAIGLAEQARELLAGHMALLGWLARTDRPLPNEYRAPRPDPSVERLASILGGVPFAVPVLAEQPTREAALLACLWSVGLKRAQQLEAAIVLARLPATLAESFAERATNFAHYPINLPLFRYREADSPVERASAGPTEADHG
jgi:hypothetical protein